MSASKHCACGKPRRPGQRNCLECHAKAQREYRKTHPLTGLAKKKDICRSMSMVYLKRGKIIKEPCIECGDENSQMHHEDYSKPREVVWMCRKCHLDHHKKCGT